MFAKQGGGYQISRSVRLRASASAYFNRTPASASNRTTWTWSAWVKRGKLGAAQVLFSAGTGTAEFRLGFISSDAIEIYEYTSPSYNWQKITTAVYRDPSAWYHIELTYDTTNGTAANRIKLYVNGTQVTSFSTDTNPTSSFSGYVNSAVAHGIGSFSTGANYLDGYLTEINFIDGQALTPTSFGAFDAVTGVWNPKKYSGTYGTNGFYLNFSDNSGATATTIGKDYSGNGNNWTPNNISVTAGTTYDSMVDTPTNYGSDTGAGGEVRGNYCVLNPLNAATTLSDANLKSNPGSASWLGAAGTLGFTSGKFYYEATITATTNTVYQIFGAARSTISKADLATNGYPGATADGWGVQLGTPSYKINNGTFTALGSNYSYTTNDVIMIAVDVDAGKFWYGKNGTWIESGNPASGTNALFTNLTGTIIPMLGQNTSGNTCAVNFGQRAFSYTAPSGYKALCTQNLPTPTVNNGANYMAASLYTGTGANQTVSNAVNSISFQPDWVWIKSRSAATDNKLTDSVRGTTKALISNTTGAETTDTNGLTAFGSSGFTVGTDTVYNNSGATYVGWQWKGGGTAVSNTAGSITSSVSANTTAGFSVVTYTGTGANATVGHGLGVAPSMVIIFERSPGGDDHIVYHSGLTSNQYAIRLNTTAAQTGPFANYWNSTSPTSTVFSVGTSGESNQSTATYVAYCFSAITGYSAFGSYTGNGSTDGPFIYLGFRPRFVLWKRSDSTGSWYIQDTSRNPYNQATLSLYPNLADAETSGDDMDYLSNGFKVRDTFAYINASGGTYIYAAFAENPFTIARAR